MEKQITFADQLKAWEKDSYALYPHCNDFFDWFCSDQSLESRANRLKGPAKKLVQKLNLDPNKIYVFFKNNCPMMGPLYDSFSICNIEDGNVICWATPKSSHTDKAEVYLFQPGKPDIEYAERRFSEILEKI